MNSMSPSTWTTHSDELQTPATAAVVVRSLTPGIKKRLKRGKSRFLALDKLQRLLPRDNINATGLLPIRHAVTLVCHKQHLGPKSRADELTIFGTLRDRLQHVCDCCAVLRVEVGVDFVEEVERRGITLLDCEDEGESAKTWDVLSIV